MSVTTELLHGADLEPEPTRGLVLGDAELILGDAISVMATYPDSFFDLAIADPPYGASTTKTWQLPVGHHLPGFGGAWQLASHEWDLVQGSDNFRFILLWLSELRRLVKPTGSLWIHATYHNSGFVNVACQMLGIEIINEVVWFKRNAFPNLAGRRLTASHETIIWAHTGGRTRSYRFNYEEAKRASFAGDLLKAAGKQLRTVWDIPNNKSRHERQFGSHPTQKPLRLTERMLLVSGAPGGRLLVPFMGSGTEMVAGLRAGMSPIGIEIDPGYFDTASARVHVETETKGLWDLPGESQ
jgi:site-specific DNA-methyltransferase (adenine-specific)